MEESRLNQAEILQDSEGCRLKPDLEDGQADVNNRPVTS